ncbi:uncharacterized protein UV8b_03341 [Ustilaginoidea virens]|uniref:Cyclin-dependent protein kinase complex component (Pcl8) n=1 Tax=Ustilaginoidea virens TaxID=1159556 RepID=A0A8E5HP68_USTVR|nr:uncharacterized protein UV8b_03341 [Ustilaginoidea virens]QUC19100.1 hypothetical protein UV8b_03341 [Ustilaginoidea virens]
MSDAYGPQPAVPPLSSDASDTRAAPAAPTAEYDGTDLFGLPAAEALRLLSSSVEVLVRMTGDIPPTPSPKTLTNPQMSGMQVEKDNIVRSHSQQNLARLRQQAGAASPSTSAGALSQDLNKLQAYSASMAAQLVAQQEQNRPAPRPASAAVEPAEPIDGVQLKHHSPEPPPYVIVGADSQPVNLQHGAITRKFYSKKEPPITIKQYLLRLHQFCPMSTAVYLATSLYIHRLAVVERAIPVTKRNAHRLVLAGLRVAMKALEDLSYPHSKIAKVGGVSEVELARLEISFCFLAGFELVVGEELLREHWEQLKDGKAQQMLKGLEVPTLKLDVRPREVSPASG